MIAYEKYWNTKIDFIGKIPEKWKLKRLKDYNEIIMGQSPNSDSYNDEGKGLPFYQGKIDFGDYNPIPRIWCTAPTKIAEPNDVLISVRAPVGELNISNERCCIGRGLTAIRTKKGYYKYAFYLLNIINEDLKTSVTGSTFEAVSSKDISTLKYLFPVNDEQVEIAGYIDKQTQIIDKLISIKKEQIEKLNDLRQIEINNAVTKGLNPNVKLKNSGIDWFGRIPIHWKIKRVKDIAEVILGKMLQNDDSGKDNLKPYLRSFNVQWEKVDLSELKEMWFSDNEIIQYRLSKFDLVVSEGGEVGRTAIWNDEIEECFIQNSVHKITCNKRLLPTYLLYLFIILGKEGYFDKIINKVSIGHLTREKLVAVNVLIPPIDEQMQIINLLNERTQKIDKLIKNIEDQISKLQELRKIIIYNAVTGKIKVTANECTT